MKRLVGLAVITLLLAACSNQSDAASPSSTTSVPKTSTTTTTPKCTVTSDTTLQRIDLDIGGTPRYALVHVPKGWDGSTSLPLVLSFHGLGASAENQMATDKFATLGDRKQFIVAYPAAIGGGSFGAAWKFNEPDTELAFVDQLLGQLESRLCVDRTRLYATGLSYGGAMTDLLSCRRPAVFAATAPVSAYLPPRPCDSNVPMPTVSFHGVEDQLLPYAGGGTSQQVAFETWGETTAARNGCTPKPAESQYRATVEAMTWRDCKEPVVLYRVHRNGHTWPGHPLGLDRTAMVDFFSGKTTGQPYPLMTLLDLTPEQFADSITLANQDIDATAMIWDFFSHHTARREYRAAVVSDASGRAYATAVTHELSALRATTTDKQERLIDHAALVLRDDARVLAAWLVGSFARGNADPWSDIDLHCTITDDSTEELRADWPGLARRITPTVQTKAFFPGSLGGYCITPEWLHLDLALHPRAALDPNTVAPMRPLFDKTGVLLPTAPTSAPVAAAEPYFPVDAVDWFFYMLGNLVTVVGRDEPVWAMNGVITLRDTGLVPLFFAERGIARVGGNKRLNPFLSDEQQTLLRNLPPLAPTIDSVIDAEAAIARIFIPRGRRLAELTGTAWPLDLERATVGHFERNLDTTIFTSA